MDSKQAKVILEKYRNGSCSQEEKKIVETWYDQLIETGDWQWGEGEKEELEQVMEARLLKMINSGNQRQVHHIHYIRTVKWVAAASIILILGAGSYFMFFNKEQHVSQKTAAIPSGEQDVNPGQFKAKLTLADGRTIVLDVLKAGELARQGKAIIYNNDGKLVYEVAGSSPYDATAIKYNTLSTGKGETYSTILADGSSVWLNSASSIKFPVAFAGNERRVEITGEAYFKVKHNDKVPFRVVANGTVVEDLGTEFNVNAYNDETTIKTTLIEGLVKVSSSNTGQSLLIKPGQQVIATVNATDAGKKALTINNSTNLDEVTGWKNGFFHFESADMKTILRQFARWYDIEVIYEGPISDERYFSIMNRNTSLANVLKSLQANQVKFRIEGKKLFVENR